MKEFYRARCHGCDKNFRTKNLKKKKKKIGKTAKRS